MEKTVTELDGRLPEPDEVQANKKSDPLDHLARFMRVLERTSGTLLGSIAVSTQIVNILVCVFGIFVGPTVIVNYLAR
jgi:hypothetical protein